MLDNLSLSETEQTLAQARAAYLNSYIESIKHDTPKILTLVHAMEAEIARRLGNERNAELWLENQKGNENPKN